MQHRGTLLLTPDERAQCEEELSATPDTRAATMYSLEKEVSGGFLVPKFIVDERPQFPVSSALDFSGDLRDYQEPVVSSVVQTLTDHNGCLLRAKCGSGKTVMGLNVASKLATKNLVILVDQLNIATQWAKELATFIPEASVQIYSSKHGDIKKAKEDEHDVKIFVAQSLMRQDWAEDPLQCSLLLVDEAHVFSSPSFLGAIFNLDFDRSLALTATDDRKDGLGWVFKKFLGTQVVEADVDMMTGVVYTPKVKINSVKIEDHYQAFCVENKKMTTMHQCRACPHFAGFPKSCGGRLPFNHHDNKVKWDSDRLMWSDLILAIGADEGYLNWVVKLIGRFLKKDRQLLVFAQYKTPLKELLKRCEETYGEEHFGIYIGGAKNKEALKKQVTFTTYAMTSKAIDMPWKDSAIFVTPSSDIRQSIGRIVRIKEGKKDPVAVDPVFSNVPRLIWQHRKKKKQYEKIKFQIK